VRAANPCSPQTAALKKTHAFPHSHRALRLGAAEGEDGSVQHILSLMRLDKRLIPHASGVYSPHRGIKRYSFGKNPLPQIQFLPACRGPGRAGNGRSVTIPACRQAGAASASLCRTADCNTIAFGYKPATILITFLLPIRVFRVIRGQKESAIHGTFFLTGPLTPPITGSHTF
jgi:hypothetical protein